MSLPDVESKYQTSQEEKVLRKDSIQDGGLQLDPHGYPLRPQPSEDPLGALNTSKAAPKEPILTEPKIL
jgi:hypothetical protein